MSQPLWTLESVSLAGAGRARLDDLSLSILPGVTAVLGYSGAGKTSLLNLLVRFERPDSGRVTFADSSRGRRLPLFWVPQSFGLWPHQSAREHVETAIHADGPAARRERAAAMLERFDLVQCAAQRPAWLSQGEQSRLAVARALAADADVLVMDEPLAHVDPARTGRDRERLREPCLQGGVSLVFATHSPEAVLAIADRAVCLDAGRIVCAGGVSELYDRPPDRLAASFLGHANWLEAADAGRWLAAADPGRRCWRPEQLAVVKSPDGPLVVESWRTCGLVVEADLRREPGGERRRFVLSATSERLEPGDRCRLM